MKILVTGGAGYIGSETVALLAGQGHHVTVLDSLEFGHPESLVDGVELAKGRTDDSTFLHRLMTDQKFDGLVHFAAYIQVSESVSDPAKYFANNTAGSLVLFETAAQHDIKRVVFSSTAAVYGNPVRVPIEEDDQ